MQQPEPGRGLDRRRLRGAGVVVDQDEVRDLLVLHEGGGVALVAGADRDDVGTQGLDLVVALTQLRGMFAAVQSTEVAQEHEHDGLVFPEPAELVLRAGGVGEREGTECGEVHRLSL